jgi:hypothetical protein
MHDFPLAGLTGLDYTVRWDDLRVGVTTINPAGSAAPPSVNTDNGTLEFSASATNIIAVEVQMPHAWEQGTAIRPHVHWRKKTEGTGAVYWRLTYEFANAGEVFTDTPVTVNSTSTSPYGADNGSALRHLITPFGDVDMTDKRVSCVGLLTIARIGGDSADTYAGVAQLLSVDIHYQVDSFGSVGEYIKHNAVGGSP